MSLEREIVKLKEQLKALEMESNAIKKRKEEQFRIVVNTNHPQNQPNFWY